MLLLSPESGSSRLQTSAFAAALLPLILINMTRIISETTMTIALCISGFARSHATQERFSQSLKTHIMEPTAAFFHVFIWLQDESSENHLLQTLHQTPRVSLILTRNQSVGSLSRVREANLLVLVSSLLSSSEDEIVGREYAQLPRSSLLPGTNNTLRMLHKLAGVEALRMAAERLHAPKSFVLRLRPDLILHSVFVFPPAGTEGETLTARVPWMCPGAALAFDQIFLLSPTGARRLALLADERRVVKAATLSDPPSTYPERLVWHMAHSEAGLQFSVMPMPGLSLAVDDRGVRDPYAKLRHDFPDCANFPPPPTRA
jgi:hypothetical protein